MSEPINDYPNCSFVQCLLNVNTNRILYLLIKAIEASSLKASTNDQ